MPGLRREEVAVLAGVSIDYYTRLERGNLTGVSDSVLEADRSRLAARRSRTIPPVRPRPHQPTTPPAPASVDPHQPHIRPGVQRLLDAMHDAPALVRNARLDVVAANRLGRALFAPAFADATTPTNLARFTFLDEQATEFFADWDDVANATVALLRVEAGRSPGDHDLSDLVGELATRSDEFRVRWAGHNVRLHDHGDKRFHHPVVGDLTLAFEELPLPADPGLTITAYTAETGTASHDALALLASWSAPAHQPARAQYGTDHSRRRRAAPGLTSPPSQVW